MRRNPEDNDIELAIIKKRGCLEFVLELELEYEYDMKGFQYISVS